MGYRIEYERTGNIRRYSFTERRSRMWPYVLGAAVMMAVCLYGFAGDLLARFLLPGDPEITGQALDTMVEGLNSGQSLTEAITAFCQEIVANANIS